jgi:hypothetical protein
LTRDDPEGFHRGIERAWDGGVHKLCCPKINANHAGRSKRQPPVGNDACYFHDPTRLHHPRNVCPVCSSAMNAAKLSYLHAWLLSLASVANALDQRKFCWLILMAFLLYAWAVNACPSPIWVLRFNTPCTRFNTPHTCGCTARPVTCAMTLPPYPTASLELPLEQRHQPQVLHC